MTASIRNRFLIIGALVALSLFSLFPREVTIRTRSESGAMQDTTITRVPLKLGLDLQGGMHLGLELDQSTRVSSDVARDVDLALTVLRKRIDEFGVQEPVVQKVGDERIVVELAGIRDPQRAMNIVQKAAFLEFRITDRTSALDKALPAMDRVLKARGLSGPAGEGKPNAVQALLGGDSASGGDTTAVTGGVLSGLIQPGAAAGSGVPGEYFVPEAAYPRVDSLFRIPDVARALPRGTEILWSASPISVGVQPYRFFYVVDEKPIVTGRNLVDASAQFDQLTNGPIVTFELDRAGGRQFGAATQAHIGDYMAIVLDGRVQGPPPVIQGRIDRNGQITMGGGKTIVEAQDLALTLKAGALPVPLKIVERVQIGPTLGADSIRGSISAGIVGTLIVVLIMIGYYRMSGVLAVTALGLYLLFTLGGLAMIDATLTLPGLAGIVLSIGIAVDANVLIFERIREELLHGRTVRLAVDEGFKHAMSAIVDSNVSTVLTALFLFQFGTGPVKGFAVTLIMGIIASMITAIFVTRTFFMLWLQRRPDLTTLSI
ncbi:MAG TPA: protein translocase subunit SecD [Gemmatimonadales bacterium]|nr:protein translocase subunit SecD [Gemmatimonadales bacterium]